MALPATGSLNRLASDAADDARGEIDDFFVTLVDGLDDDAIDRAAIGFVDDDVLRRVDELAGEVTGIRGLERGIGENPCGRRGSR